MTDLLLTGLGGAPASRIASIRALSPKYYWEMGYASDPLLGQILYKDIAGLLPVTAVGDSIGNAVNLGTGGVAPLVAAANNTRPIWQGGAGAQFDGVDDDLAATITPLSTVTASFGQKCKSTNGFGFFFYGGLVTPAAGFFLLVGTGAQYLLLTSDGISNTNPTSIPAPTTGSYISLYANSQTPATDYLTENGVSMIPASAGLAATTVSAEIGTAIGSYPWAGFHRAFVVFDRNLSAADQAAWNAIV